MRSFVSAFGACTSLLPVVSAAAYILSTNTVGSAFFSDFTHQAIPDPTHGRVNYVDQWTAQSLNLSFASDNSFIMRADDTTTLSASGPGRNSVRIRSLKTYTHHVVIFDINHMPQGCATWPAAWEVDEADWPNEGEVDIVEGVNDQTPNQSALHTSPGCTMPGSTTQTGSTISTDCNTAVNGNQGCSVHIPGTNSYGPGFNHNGGGWYAMERTSSFVRVWFWPRSSNPPFDVSSGGIFVNTDNWGTPSANFPNTSCDLDAHLGQHNIIINLTLCGDWAGAVFGSDGCHGDCVDFVNKNPGAFSNAFWDIAAIRTYEQVYNTSSSVFGTTL